MLLLFITSTSVWGLSKLWGGFIPSSDIASSATRIRNLTLLFYLAPDPLFYCEAPTTWILPDPAAACQPTPASLSCSSLRLALRDCVCYRSCAGSLPPSPPSTCTQVPVCPWGVCTPRVPPRLFLPVLSSPSSPPNIDIVRFWCPS